MSEMAVINQVNRKNLLRKNEKRRLIFITILFFFFLFPFSLAIGDEGLSANYTFVLFPIVLIVAKGYIKRLPDYLVIFTLLYTSIFIIGTIYQIDFLTFFARRVISYFLFITMFLYLFIDIDKTMVDSFKYSIVAIAIYFSLSVLQKYITLGPEALGFAAKGEIGSQRFGFVYVMAIWLCWFYDAKSSLSILIKFLIICIITIGLMLTFSRSGIVALGASAFFFIIHNILVWTKNPQIQSVFKFAFYINLLIGLFFVLGIIFPIVFEFFNVRLFSFFWGTGEETLDLFDADSSEGFRIYLIQKAFRFVAINPFTGSGFLGMWVLFDNHSGSAHNQYLDIFFRTGILGFTAYTYLIIKMLRGLYIDDKSLFWGFLGIIVYGLFHETFKLSQGAFIFSFILGMISSRKEIKHIHALSK